MQQTPQNPFVVFLWLLGIPGGLAFFIAMVKLIFFVAKASGKLDTIDELAKDFKSFRHDTRDGEQAIELSLTIIENDVNALQVKAGLPVRPFPDRRTGPFDRRAS